MKTCQTCGHTGPDVIIDTMYVGGTGYCPIVRCRDIVACWRRYDERYGLVPAKKDAA